jgi:hypothetical protein
VTAQRIRRGDSVFREFPQAIVEVIGMPDPAEQLQRIYLAGFEVQTFERYPRAVGVIRDNVIALLETSSSGLRLIGEPGWRMGEVMGVLVNENGRQVFRAKQEAVQATPERIEALRRFREDLDRLLMPTA